MAVKVLVKTDRVLVLQNEQSEAGQFSPGNFQCKLESMNPISSSSSVNLKATHLPGAPTVMGVADQVDPARFDPPLFSVFTIVSSVRIISVTATLTNSLVCLDGALLVFSGSFRIIGFD
jgi:hypothetical protein